MTEKKFTSELKKTFEYIQNTLLKEYNCDKITTEYFILSVLENDFCVGHKILSKIMLHDAIENSKVYFYKWLSAHSKTLGMERGYDEVFEKCVHEAKKMSIKQKSKTINSGHVLLSIMMANSEVNRYFKTVGVTVGQINSQVIEETQNLIQDQNQNNEIRVSTPRKHVKKEKKQPEEVRTIILNSEDLFANNSNVDGECGRVTNNLNELAQKSQIESIWGNDKIYKEIFNVLSKRNKNNVILVGKSGVGKSDTARNLANLIVKGEVPKTFRDKVLLEVDFNSLFSGTQMRGAFEAKMKAVLTEVRQKAKYIFLIDSIENALNGHYSQNEVQDFFEALMREKNAMLICTCSEKSYSKEIGDNPSWERYFEKINLEEPNDEDCREILKHHLEKLELFHNVKYEESVLDTCIKYSKRYITERSLPDSAIDILDKVGAKKSMSDSEPKEIIEYREEIKKVKEEIDKVKHNYTQSSIQSLDELIRKEIELKSSLDNEIKQYNIQKTRQTVNDNDIKECISEKTNIPVTDLTVDDKDKLKGINERIKKIVIGQDEAVDTVCRAIKRQRIGISNPNKPVVFLMAGSTGVGKSYLAKIIAKEIFGDEKKLVRLDMSEYSDKTSVNKIHGAGSGYIGYENGGILTEAIKKNKHCVLLLDEIEKANEEVHNTFLSMFDEGRMTDNKGITVDFKNVIVIMTSNVGAKEVEERGNGIGFVTNEQELKKEIIEKELKRKFKPEFLNRIDKIVYFNKLTDENIKFIINLEIDKVRERIENMGYHLGEISEDSELFNTIYNNVKEKKNMGARPIIRELQTLIEDKITDYIIDNEVENGYTFNVTDIYM